MAARLNLEVSPDSEPEQGHYFRSDHFSFAHSGVPAFSIGGATEFAGKPAGYGHEKWVEYNTKQYHHPADEFQEDWDFTALAQAAEYGFLLGRDVANQDKLRIGGRAINSIGNDGIREGMAYFRFSLSTPWSALRRLCDAAACGMRGPHWDRDAGHSRPISDSR